MMCGDWPLSDIISAWPKPIADELATFVWPINSVAELDRLLACTYASPRNVTGGEFTRTVAREVERLHGEVTLSVDLRAALYPGVHARLDMRLVLHRKRWHRAFAFPPCTHQTLSDTTARTAKQLDGRMFWGILLVIFCYCTPALMLLVEQPDTVIPDLFIQPTQRLRSSELGDSDDKCINLFERGRERLIRTHPSGGTSGHGRLSDFANADERDAWRSSWERFPLLATAVATAAHNPHDALPDPSFETLREAFAVACYHSGIYVPLDYEARLATPLSEEDQRYQFVRGQGSGVRRSTTIPRSLRQDDASLVVAPTSDPHDVIGQEVDLRILSAHAMCLCFVAMQAVPLIFAFLNGFTIIGAELHAPTQRRISLTIATQWTSQAVSASASTFLVGEYVSGARLFTTPLNLNVPPAHVVRTAAERRRRCKAGFTAAWCTLAALAGTVAYDPAARALAACSALRGPVSHLSDAATFGHSLLGTFSFGVFAMTPLVNVPAQLSTISTPADVAVRSAWLESQLLAERLRMHAGLSDDDLLAWADVIKPMQLHDVPDGLFEHLPTFDDPRLDDLAFLPDPTPATLPRLLPRPSQPPLAQPRCPRSAFDLMPESTRRKIRRWLLATLKDLVCMRDLGVDCERSRPPTLVIGQDELFDWARGYVWDFRNSPSQCGAPLDYSAPIRPTLNVDFFERELATYPDQRLLGFISTGVIYMADVELQAVFVPHLVSLPKGFRAVAKELRRLHDKGWYDFFPIIPLFPLYCNAQGSTARKLEPDRDRRTTEGGGPRKDIWDRTGLKAISINLASSTFHMPRHYYDDVRPEFQAWLRSRGLPATADQIAQLAAGHIKKWGQQVMPTLKQLARNLLPLRRVARLLGMPLYLFGDDIKDFFNHLENAPSELPLMNIAFLAEDADFEEHARSLATADVRGNTLVFVLERRMGFGIHPNSGIAQDLSDGIDHIFRKRMDAVEDPINEADPRPSMQQWLAKRRVLEAKVGGHQRRLYTCFTFCDDSITGVVGVDQAIRAIKLRRSITSEAGLIMAIPEKRMLGVWGLWLGIFIFSSLGLIVVSREKLLRATSACRRAVANQLTFDDYRSLTGLLEHIRHACSWPRRIMHGLYKPHGLNGESQSGPSTIVRPNYFMTMQLQHWVSLLSNRAGSAFTHFLKRAHLPLARRGRVIYFASSDAATDSVPPGMGGFMHGMYWYIALTSEMIRWLHISVLELLASGFSCMIYADHTGPEASLELGADALATVTTLVNDSERSEMLTITHHALLGSPHFRRASQNASASQLRGDANLAADAVSRGEWATFFNLCRDLRIRPTQLPVPPECRAILSRVLQAAIARGVPVRPNPYVSQPTVLTADYQRHLSRSHREDRSVARERLRSPERLSLLCPRCGEPLPLELSGRGRCPSCSDYDGPVLLDDYIPLELVEYISRLLYADFPVDALLFLSSSKAYRVCIRHLNFSALLIHSRPVRHIHHPTMHSLGAPMAFGLTRLRVADAWTTSRWKGQRDGRLMADIPCQAFWSLGTLNRTFWMAFLNIHGGDSNPRLRCDNIYLDGHGDLVVTRLWLDLRTHNLPPGSTFEVLNHNDVRLGAQRLRRTFNQTDYLLVRARFHMDGLRLTLFLTVDFKIRLYQAPMDLPMYPDAHEWRFEIFDTSISSLHVENLSLGVLPHSAYLRKSYLGRAIHSIAHGSGPVQPIGYCVRCGELLPPEHFGLGRCPSCVDYDGPSGYAQAARAAGIRPLNPTASRSGPARVAQPPRPRFHEPTRQLASRLAPRASVSLPSGPTEPGNDDAMPVAQAGSQLLAAPSPNRKERANTKRKRAMLEFAHRQAEAMASPSATAQQRADVRAAVIATSELADYGAAFGTLDKDDLAWEFWERFCAIYGWDTTFDVDFAAQHPAQICQRLAIFQAWVYPQLRGRGPIKDAKPQTAFNNYVLAVRRILMRAHIPMPSAKSIEKNLAGLNRTFKNVHDIERLMPQHKQAMTPALWARIEALTDGAVIPGRSAHWSPRTRWRDRTLLRLGRVLWRTGHRLGEIIAHPSGEVNFLTRSCLSIRKVDGSITAVPSALDWQQLRSGDMVLLAPCPSKTDPFGLVHCPFPSVLPYDGSDTCAAAAVRDIELEQPCTPAARKTTPLFADEQGHPFTYSVLHRELRLVIAALLGPAAASIYSWHSVRSGLACALHAAGCPDEIIQLLCRWTCPQSLHVYRQMGVEKNVLWTEKAQHAVFDTARVNHLPQLDQGTRLDALGAANFEDAASPPSPMAQHPHGSLPSTFPIPGGTVQASRSDPNNLVGLTVRVPRTFWRPQDLGSTTCKYFACDVVAACLRDFKHADGSRVPTLLISHNDQFFPIKSSDLIHSCLTRAQREERGL